MIDVTNDAEKFFSNTHTPLLVYGAGNAGYWVGHYLNICRIDFACYLDRSVKHEGALCNERPVFTPAKLKEYSGRFVRIIVTPHSYKDILNDLLWAVNKHQFDALCLVPQYVYPERPEGSYNINHLLGFFRKQLIDDNNLPTFIANDCTDSFLFDFFDMPLFSPTVNIGFSAADFIKLCQNPEKYLKRSLTNITWQRFYHINGSASEQPGGYLEDVFAVYGHAESEAGIEKNWEMLKRHINWDNLIFIMQDSLYPVSKQIRMTFDKTPHKHLFVGLRGHYGSRSENEVFFRANHFHDRVSVLENHFDLVEWINS